MAPRTDERQDDPAAEKRTIAMAASADRVVEWRGSSIDELVRMLTGPALAARIQVFAQEGGSEQLAGEVHMLAGGVAEAVSGPVRGDEAMAELRALPAPIRCMVEPAVPDPGTGRLVPSGPEEGKLGERSLASLMRYCEDYVMTCLLEVWKGGEHAAITYRKGEIASTTVDGSDAAERLPEVMTWMSGNYRLVLPPLVLPSTTPTRKPTPLEGRTLFGYRAPSPPWPERDGVARSTSPFASAPDGDGAFRRATAPGMPIDVYDATTPERTTDVGVPKMEPPRPAAAIPVAARSPSPAQGTPATTPGKGVPVSSPVPSPIPAAAPSPVPAPAAAAAKPAAAHAHHPPATAAPAPAPAPAPGGNQPAPTQGNGQQGQGKAGENKGDKSLGEKIKEIASRIGPDGIDVGGGVSVGGSVSPPMIKVTIKF
jgi:hypothetical protein